MLDDRPFTNKNWARVSHFRIDAINSMEIEFLSNIQYSLYVSEQEWEEWLSKLNCFQTNYNRALEAYYRPPAAKNYSSSPPLAEKIAYEVFNTPPMSCLQTGTATATGEFASQNKGGSTKQSRDPLGSWERPLQFGPVGDQLNHHNVTEMRLNTNW